MIDNIHLIKPLLNFESEDEFYMLYIFKRKKDQTTDKANHQSVRTIKSYCIESIEQLDNRYEEIKQLCEIFKARAYIHVQKQSHKDIGMIMITELVNRIQAGNFNQKHVFDSVVGQIKTKEKRWIVDIDIPSIEAVQRISLLIDKIRPEGPKTEAVTITKNGYHLITKPFDVQEFNKYMSLQGDVPDIQKKNPTLLYFPNSLDEV
jgi:hypothetical protein